MRALLVICLAFAAVTSAAAKDDEPAELRDMFRQACIDARIPAELVKEVDPASVKKIFLRNLEGASEIRVFEITSLEKTFLVFARLQGRADGAEQRCGIFSRKWNLAEAKRAVFLAPPFVEGEPTEVDRRIAAHAGNLEKGVRHTPTFLVEVAYGKASGYRYMMLTKFSSRVQKARLMAAAQVGACAQGRTPLQGNCHPRSLHEANEVFRSYNGL